MALWARSYAQYIAIKSKDALLIGQLDKLRIEKEPNQWSDSEIVSIMQAFDETFRSLGWLKKNMVRKK